MKQQVPSIQGFALCDKCFATLQHELKQHKKYTSRTYVGSVRSWTQGQVRFLAQSIGIELERFRKGHKVHTIAAKDVESNEIESESEGVDLPTQGVTTRSPEVAAKFGERFLTLMDKRPDINQRIMEILQTKLNPSTTPPVSTVSPIPTKSPSFFVVSPLPNFLSSIPSTPTSIPSLPHAPLDTSICTNNCINSTHNFNFNFHPESGPNCAFSSPPTTHTKSHSNNCNSIFVNINFNLPTSSHLSTTFLSEVNNAVKTSLQRHSALLTTPSTLHSSFSVSSFPASPSFPPTLLFPPCL